MSSDGKAYPQAVRAWRESGLGYPLPLPRGTKSPPPDGFTGAEGAVPSDADYDDLAASNPAGNTCLRLAPHVVGIDVDAYTKNGNQKKGAATLVALEEAHGALPASWTSTSRDDAISGIRLYTADPALIEEFAGNAGPDIEVIRYGHRYLVVYPSIHPDTGDQYRLLTPEGAVAITLPTPDDLPRLPDEWIRHLTANGRCPCKTRGSNGGLILTPHTPKYGTVKAAVEALEHSLNGGGSRHDTATSVTMALLRFAERGDPDATNELDRLRDLYLDTVAADRDRDPKRGRWRAEREWGRMVAGADRKIEADPSAVTMPDGYTMDRTLRHTDVDNSTRLVELHGDRLRYVTEWGTWIVWDGTRWLIDRNRVAVSELAKDVSSALYRQASETKDPDVAKKVAGWASQSATRGRIESMTHLARGIDGVVISHDDLDTNPWLLGVQNGYINLRDGTFHQPDPDKLMTMQAPVSYDPTADATRWRQALEEWFTDPDVRSYVQRLSGHAASGDPLGDHVFAIHYGDGRNGKGTYMRAHKHVLGPYYVTPDKSLLIQKRHEQHATVKARLFRTRLAVASETEQRERLNEAQIKNLTGGDPINARRMREDEWEFEPTHSLWLQTNYPPEIHGSDTGIWSRIKIVPWTETFNGRTDPNLDGNLAAEAAGILNWIIAGCLQWQEDGLNEPEAVIRATLDYRDSEDVLARYADDTGFTFSKSGSVADSELKKNIAEWAYDEGVDKPDAKKVNAWMKAHGCRSKSGRYKRQDGTSGRGKIWKGARFSRPEDEPSKPAEIHGTAGESAHPVTSVTALPVQRLEDASYETNRHSGDTGDKSVENVDTATPTGGNEEQGDRLTCPRCGEVPKAIYPSGFCGDCDAAEVAP